MKLLSICEVYNTCTRLFTQPISQAAELKSTSLDYLWELSPPTQKKLLPTFSHILGEPFHALVLFIRETSQCQLKVSKRNQQNR